jgi:membrane protein DedA with SNARE-associated domain
MDALIARLSAHHGPAAYAVLFALLVGCGVGLPMNEDLLLLAASVLAYYGAFATGPLVALSIVAVVLGDALALLAGARFGHQLQRRPWLARLVPPEKLAAAQARFRGRGHRVLFVARFLPGVRTLVFFAAGTLGIPLRALWLYDGLGALLEVPALVLGVRLAAGNAAALAVLFRRFQTALVALLLLAVLAWWLRRRRAQRRASTTPRPQPEVFRP